MFFTQQKFWIVRLVLISALTVGSVGIHITKVVAAPGDTTLISMGSLPSPLGANNDSYRPSISADGRYVAFYSSATNLASNDTNGKTDIFVFDRQTGLVERVSVDSSGGQANGNSSMPAISADGRFVAFRSDASNLVSNDTNGGRDVFFHDRQTGLTERISTAPDSTGSDAGYIPPAISADGRYVAFDSDASNLVDSDTNGVTDIFVFDRQTGLTERVSVDANGEQGNQHSFSPAISSDGRYVAFSSGASNLVVDDTNDTYDIFVFDRQMGVIERVSIDSNGGETNGDSDWPSFSADGRYVVFQSYATNLVGNDTNGQVDVFVHDRQTGETERISIASSGVQGNYNSSAPSISADGRYVAFASYASTLVNTDMNSAWDIFIHDRQSGLTQRVSVDSSGLEGNSHSNYPVISANGRYVSFESDANNLGGLISTGGIFVHNRQTDETEPVSVGPVGMGANQGSYVPSISADGRYVSFLSNASNLVSGDTNRLTDVFVHDGQSGVTERVSVSSGGIQINGSVATASISANGRYVVFASQASNLVADDTNHTWDVFVHDRETEITERVSISSSGVQGNGSSQYPAISADGRYVAFESFASNLVSGDTGVGDIFLHDRQTGVTERVSVAPGGGLPNGGSFYKPAISEDGRYVAFYSSATNLISGDTNGKADVFVYDRQLGLTERVSIDSSGVQANNHSNTPSISADGRYVSFVSTATNLVNTDTNGVDDIFVHDRQTEITRRVSVASNGMQASAATSSPSISANGRYVSFASTASNLVNEDTNGVTDIFVHDYQTGTTERVAVDSSGMQANAASSSPAISANGQFVTFSSSASNLVNGDSNYSNDIFVHENDISPEVVGIVRADPNPTSAATVDFAVTFSESVTGVDMTDFSLTVVGLTDASLTEVSGSGTTYTVTVNTGSGNGTIRLDVVDDDSIQDEDNIPLGGVGIGNGDFTSGETYDVDKLLGIPSSGPHDGWLLESSENSTIGGTKNNTATTLRVGDDAANKQYRSILSFDTSSLPDNAILTAVTLKFKYAGKTGTLHFDTHGNLLADVRMGAFRNNPALELGDFNAKGTSSKYKVKALIYTSSTVESWYSQALLPADFQYINLIGITQFRLRFARDDNNDFGADFLKLFSGNAVEADRPQLVIEYYVP